MSSCLPSVLSRIADTWSAKRTHVGERVGKRELIRRFTNGLFVCDSICRGVEDVDD